MKRLVWFVVAVIVILTAGVVAFTQTRVTVGQLDTVELNRVTRVIQSDWPDALSGQLPPSSLDYTFVPAGGSLHDFISNSDTLVDITVDAQVVGTIVVFNQTSAAVADAARRHATIFAVMVTLLAVCCAGFAWYQYATIIRPFRKLEGFALRVAGGDLELPLQMDKTNRFGAFTESFDLMRHQLAAARETERRADEAKKELIASLSHDIKNPVGAITVMAELSQAKYGVTDETTAIIAKAGQIDLLISNLFTATMEEMERLQVSVEDVTAADLASEITEADYQHKVTPVTLPECVVTVDRLRFRQIVDNVLGNSYKYAGTAIEVSGYFDDGYLVITVRDFGAGASPREQPLLCEKFYRGTNAEGKPGVGLGLFLSRYFLTEMGGRLTVECHDGFWVRLWLPL